MQSELDAKALAALKDAVEGECEGLAINDNQAVSILAYVLAALPQAEPGWRMKVHGVSLAVASALVETFGGEETDMTVAFIENGHSGPGFYSWCTEYPEDGAEFLGQASEFSTLPTAPTPTIEEGRSDVS